LFFFSLSLFAFSFRSFALRSSVFRFRRPSLFACLLLSSISLLLTIPFSHNPRNGHLEPGRLIVSASPLYSTPLHSTLLHSLLLFSFSSPYLVQHIVIEKAIEVMQETIGIGLDSGRLVVDLLGIAGVVLVAGVKAAGVLPVCLPVSSAHPTPVKRAREC
jgi:hypothetical protein